MNAVAPIMTKLHIAKTLSLPLDAIKFLTIAGAILGCLSIMYGAVTFLQGHGITGTALGWVALISGFGVLLVVFLLARRRS